MGFRDRIQDFQDRNIVLFGVSTDTPEDNCAFRQKLELPFSLLSDTERSVCLAYGTCAFTDAFYAERTTFIIDEQGVIRKVFSQVQPGGHADEVLRAVETFEANDSYSIPAPD